MLAAAAVSVPPNHEEKGILLLSISAIVLLLSCYMSLFELLNIQTRSSSSNLSKAEHFLLRRLPGGNKVYF